MEKPELDLIRRTLGKALKSLPAEELDRKALEIWLEEKKKYENYCLKLEEERKKLQKEGRKRVEELVKKYREA